MSAPSSGHSTEDLLGVDDVLRLPARAADARVAYGPDPLQFGDLRLPPGPGPHPVAVVLHGGCWRSRYTLELMDPLASALAGEGMATWNLEYRRLGDAEGGWPGTFRDVADGIDHLRSLADAHALDLGRVVLLGHSAGGHLALWAAGRDRVPPGSPIADADPLPVRGAVGLGAIVDLSDYVCGRDTVAALMGGLPDERPERYRAASPVEMLPLDRPRALVTGEDDATVPPGHLRGYVEAAEGGGEDVRVTIVPRAGHFEVIAPGSIAWPVVRGALTDLLADDGGS